MAMTAAGHDFYRLATPEQKQTIRKRAERARELTETQRRLLLALLGRWNPKTGAWYVRGRLDEIAASVGCCARHGRRLLHQLQAMGFIERQSTGRRRRKARWLPAVHRFRPGERLFFGLMDVPRPGQQDVPKRREKSQANRGVPAAIPAKTGQPNVPPRETLKGSLSTPADERAALARPAGDSCRSINATLPQQPGPAPGSANGLASKLRLPDEAARFLVDATPARCAGTRKNQTHPGQASLFAEPPKAKPKKQISSLSEAAVQRFLAEDPSWADQHPPGSLFWRNSQTYVVPLWHPRVPVEDSPSRLERIRKRAGPLAGDNAGERFAVLERVRLRFPAAQKRLVEPALAHELARAELIVRELEAAEAASQPAAVLDFSEVRDWLDAFERETRYSLPRYQNYPVAPGPLTERWQRMETSAAYLDDLSAAIKASPAKMWEVPVELNPLKPLRRQKGRERPKLPQAPLSLTLHSFL